MVCPGTGQVLAWSLACHVWPRQVQVKVKAWAGWTKDKAQVTQDQFTWAKTMAIGHRTSALGHRATGHRARGIGTSKAKGPGTGQVHGPSAKRQATVLRARDKNSRTRHTQEPRAKFGQEGITRTTEGLWRPEAQQATGCIHIRKQASNQEPTERTTAKATPDDHGI